LEWRVESAGGMVPGKRKKSRNVQQDRMDAR